MIKATPTTLAGMKGYFITEEDFTRLAIQWQEVENLFARTDERKPKSMVQALPREGGTA